VFTLEVRGVKELQAAFDAIKADMYEGLAAALLAGAMPVNNAAKTLAPYKTGNLMRSYHVGLDDRDITAPQNDAEAAPRMTPAEPGAVREMARRLRERGIVRVLVGTDVEYAPVQEFLNKPHLRPALEQNRGEVQQEVNRAIAQVIKKAARA